MPLPEKRHRVRNTKTEKGGQQSVSFSSHVVHLIYFDYDDDDDNKKNKEEKIIKKAQQQQKQQQLEIKKED